VSQVARELQAGSSACSPDPRRPRSDSAWSRRLRRSDRPRS